MKKELQFHIGCSGYYNKHWRNIFYPEKLPQSKWFNFYCECFNTLELNSTFYKFPTAKSLQAWYSKSPDDFLFSVKAPRLITHLKKFNDINNLVKDFYLACEQGLEHKLGCILFQFPPGMHYSAEKLELIVAGLKPEFQNVIEFRHKSWWTQRVYDELKKNKIIFCSVNHPTLPSTIIANNSIAYVRLHGNPEMFYSDYSKEELIQLHHDILKKKKIKEVYIYFNNTAGTAGVLNAQQLKSMLKK